MVLTHEIQRGGVPPVGGVTGEVAGERIVTELHAPLQDWLQAAAGRICRDPAACICRAVRRDVPFQVSSLAEEGGGAG